MEDLEKNTLNANEEIQEELELNSENNLVVYSRDWTVETIFSQISRGNIDLNPKFQRRNAWNDEKRSRLIESIIIGIPIPEIVLAEHPTQKKKFIVIDGKQRLLTIAGFIDNENYVYWDKPELKKLKSKTTLNTLSITDLKSNFKYEDEYRSFMNSDIRCTVITNYSTTDVLYDIFHRLNSGSTPLSMQELRQVLNKGDFANFLIETTQTLQPIHSIMGLDGADNRLNDVEIILKYISLKLFNQKYTGNLKKFLDESMRVINENWQDYEVVVKNLYDEINKSIERLKLIFGDCVARKYKNGKYEGKFNRTLFEVEVYLFSMVNIDTISEDKASAFKSEFESLCSTSSDFLQSIESSTKDLRNYKTRFKQFGAIVKKTFNIEIGEFLNEQI